MAIKIGTVTIGQSPRTDVMSDILPLLRGLEIEERGALNGLSFEEIEKLSPSTGDYVLVTRLQDGRSVRIAEKHILERMQMHIDDLIRNGADGILLLCTGEFPAFVCSKPVLYPQRLLQYFVAGVAADQVVGVFTPDKSQVPQSTKRWLENGQKHVIVESATPYEDYEKVIEAGLALKRRGAQVLVMDCIGYTCQMKEEIAVLTGLPVILPRTVAARTVVELFGTFVPPP